MRRALLCGAWLCCGCGSGPALASLPQLVSSGGPVLGQPLIVPVTFAGDPLGSQIGQFATSLTTSSWWASAVGPYGVTATQVNLSMPPDPDPSLSLTDGALRQKILALIAGPAASVDLASAVFALFTPSGVAVTVPLGPGSSESLTLCAVLGAYHSFLQLPSGQRVAYAVIPRCPPAASQSPALSGLTQLQALTAFASHEIAEAATDPYAVDLTSAGDVDAEPAFLFTDDLAWTLALGSEIGDLCESQAAPFFQDQSGFTVQHLWSNAAAQNRQDPCGQGGTAQPYFNAAPELSDSFNVQIPAINLDRSTVGLKLSVGETRTLTVDVFGAGATPGDASVTVQALDLGELEGAPSTLSLALDQATAKVGSQLHLTVTATEAGDFKGVAGLSAFVLVTSLGGQSEIWPVLVSSD